MLFYLESTFLMLSFDICVCQIIRKFEYQVFESRIELFAGSIFDSNSKLCTSLIFMA